MRRVVSVWFPHWPTDRLRRRLGTRLAETVPLVTALHDGRKRVVAAADRAAAGLGLRPGMAVAQALALVPGLEVMEAEPDGDAEALRRLAIWCHALTPLAAPSPPDGVWLDMTGSAHLLGGEPALLRRLLARLARDGLQARAAASDTPGAAHALARHATTQTAITPPGGHHQALATLPIACLRIPVELEATLRRLGFDQVCHLARIPRALLARRFGALPGLRLDQAFGHVQEPIDALPPEHPLQRRMAFVEPLLTAESFQAVIPHLVEPLCADMERQGLGARQLDLLFERVDGHVEAIRIGAARPSRDTAHLVRLLVERLETIDPGLGVEAMRLVAPLAEALQWEQQEEGAGRPVAQLVDRLVNRLGPDAVYQAAPAESDVPERMTRLDLASRGMAGFDPAAHAMPTPHAGRELKAADAERQHRVDQRSKTDANTFGTQAPQPQSHGSNQAIRPTPHHAEDQPPPATSPERQHAINDLLKTRAKTPGAHAPLPHSHGSNPAIHARATPHHAEDQSPAATNPERQHRVAQRFKTHDNTPGAHAPQPHSHGFDPAIRAMATPHHAEDQSPAATNPEPQHRVAQRFKTHDNTPGTKPQPHSHGSNQAIQATPHHASDQPPPATNPERRPAIDHRLKTHDNTPGTHAPQPHSHGFDPAIRATPPQTTSPQRRHAIDHRSKTAGSEARSRDPDTSRLVTATHTLPPAPETPGKASQRQHRVGTTPPEQDTGAHPAPRAEADDVLQPTPLNRSLLRRARRNHLRLVGSTPCIPSPAPPRQEPAVQTPPGQRLPGQTLPTQDPLQNDPPLLPWLPRDPNQGGARLTSAIQPSPKPWPNRLHAPARLLTPPRPVKALAALPDQPPAAFTWRRRHRIRRAEGPERIFGEWWHTEQETSAVRDYFIVEDEEGQRFWLFRRGNGIDPRSGDLEWFLHGLF